ncbi:serine protease inhibitor A3L-like [Hyla sarda]|uniref:serine protease inhibitor A3L-like n=1 Tax=Hyla sarda TaxID=327740 RepID=UPI0024C22A24|nr:serine protease inhibitor A3L-like [Hyla sarda]
MKTLLFLCVGVSLVHLVVPKVSYMTIKAPRHLPPKNSLDFAFISVECDYQSLVSTYKDLDNPMSTFQSTDGVSIFLSSDRSPGNEDAQVIATNFKNPSEAKTQLNSHVTLKTSGKIKDLFSGFQESTDAVVVSCADKWKVPVSEGSQYPVQLKGEYNVMVDKNLGFTMLEIPRNQYVSALIILPDGGKEAAVSAAVNDANLAKWRKSLTKQVVDLEVPRATLYVCSALTTEIVLFDESEYKTNKFAAKIAVTFP